MNIESKRKRGRKHWQKRVVKKGKWRKRESLILLLPAFDTVVTEGGGKSDDSLDFFSPLYLPISLSPSLWISLSFSLPVSLSLSLCLNPNSFPLSRSILCSFASPLPAWFSSDSLLILTPLFPVSHSSLSLSCFSLSLLFLVWFSLSLEHFVVLLFPSSESIHSLSVFLSCSYFQNRNSSSF